MAINTLDLDEREQYIFSRADQYWATRFHGRGSYEKLGPFTTPDAAEAAVRTLFAAEDERGDVPGTILNRPFALYAAASTVNEAHVIVGNIYRDGKERLSRQEIRQRHLESRGLTPKPSRSGNKNRSD